MRRHEDAERRHEGLPGQAGPVRQVAEVVHPDVAGAVARHQAQPVAGPVHAGEPLGALVDHHCHGPGGRGAASDVPHLSASKRIGSKV